MSSRISEIEQRIAAVEVVIATLMPWLGAYQIHDALYTLRARLQEEMPLEEAEILLKAVTLLGNGENRWKPFWVGDWMRTGGESEEPNLGAARTDKP